MNPSLTDLFHPDLLLAVEVLSLLAALFFVISGRVSVRIAQTLTLVGFVAILGVGLRYGVLLVENEQFEVPLIRGWLLPRTMPGALQVGVLFGRAGFFLSSLVALSGISFVLSSLTVAASKGSVEPSERSERELAAGLLGALGVQLSWLSVSVWQALAGVGLAVLGGFFAIGSRWRRETDATLSVRFALERIAPLSLAFAGAASLASHSVSLVFDGQAKPGLVGGGAALLLIGLLLLVPQIPLLGSLVAPVAGRLLSRVLLVHALPALACAGVFFHLARTYQTPLLPVVASLLVLSSCITAVVGLAQKDWRRALGPWVSAGVSLAIAAFLSAEPSVGVTILIPAIVAPLLVAALADSAEKALPKWSVVVLGLLATSWPGSVGIAGRAQWWWAAHESGSGALLLVFFAEVLVALLAWRLIGALARCVAQESTPVVPSLWQRLGVGALVLPLVGVLWVGSFTGGAWLDDQLFTSFVASLFRAAPKLTSEAQQSTAVYHGMALLVGGVMGFWLSGTAEGDRWLAIQARFPRVSSFLEAACGSESFLRQLRTLLMRLGAATSRILEGGLWQRVLPAVSEAFRGRLAPSLERLDGAIRSKVGAGLSRLVALPGRGLQVVQSGDIQWYLFFALTTGIGFILIF